jgi:malate permease and related proteins
MLMIMLGYYLTQINWFNKDIGQLFSKFAMTVTIPLYMIVSMMRSYKKEDLLQLGVAVIVPLCSMLALWIIGIIVSRIIKIPEYRRGVFRAMFFVSNSAFIGFPVNIALFGDKALPIAVMYYLVQSLLFWTIGAYGLSIDGPKFARLQNNENSDVAAPSVLSLQTIKNIMSPPLIGAVVAILLILFSVKLPTFATSTMNYLGSMTTPLAMLFIGIAIYVANLRSVRITVDMGILIAARFLIAPAVTIAVCYAFNVPEFMRSVLIIESAMPVMTQVSIAARAYKADANYVAVMTALTTVLALFTIPTYFILLTFKII